jgi:hypothetical protein
MTTYEVALAFCGPRNQTRIILKVDADTRQKAEDIALRRGRAMTGRRMKVSERATA